MKNFKHIKYKVTIAFAFFVLVAFISNIIYFNRHDWEPVDIPITTLDSNIEATFKADLDGLYFISMIVHPIKNFDYWNCVLNSTRESGNCKSGHGYITAQWNVRSISGENVEIIKRGNKVVEGNYSSHYLTSFNAQNTVSYKVNFILQGPKSTILDTQPRMKIEVDSDKYKESYIVSLFLSFIAIGLALATIISYFIESRKIDRNSNISFHTDAASPRR